MNKISVKLALIFISIILVSSALSFFASTLFPQRVASEIRQNQKEIAGSIRELNQKTDLSLDEILRITSTSMFDVHQVKYLDEVFTEHEDMERVQSGEIVFLNDGRFVQTTALFRVDDTYIRIGLHPQNTIFAIMASRLRDSLLFYIFIGVLLIVVLVNRVVKPILKLTQATQEIAKGNFDIQVEMGSKDEIGQLTENFNQMARELKSIEYLRKDFINNVSHEIKTPIASIQGFARLLQRQDLGREEQAEYTQIIVEETARLSHLSSNMMKISKLENQDIVERDAHFSLDEQIRRSILLLELEWQEKNITFNIELEPVIYQGNEELLQHVWLNILGNAIKFSGDDGYIDISLRQDGKLIKVVIADKGIGMDLKTQSRIFEKFYQGDSAHLREGSGLGLPLVKRIVDLHGGEILVESIQDQGSAFTVTLLNDR